MSTLERALPASLPTFSTLLEYPLLEREVLLAEANARLPESLRSSLGFDDLEWKVEREGMVMRASGYHYDAILGTIEVVTGTGNTTDKSGRCIRIAGVHKPTGRVLALQYGALHPRLLERVDLSLKRNIPHKNPVSAILLYDVSHVIYSGVIGSQDLNLHHSTSARITPDMLRKCYGDAVSAYHFMRFQTIKASGPILQPLDRGRITGNYISVGTHQGDFIISNFTADNAVGEAQKSQIWSVAIPGRLSRGTFRSQNI